MKRAYLDTLYEGVIIADYTSYENNSSVELLLD